VSLVNSEIFSSHSAVFGAGARYFSCECRLDDERYETAGELAFVKEEDPLAIKTKPAFAVGKPTRVRYNMLRLGLRRGNALRSDPHTKWQAMVEFPLYLDTQHGYLQFDFGARVRLAANRLDLRLDGYKTLHTEDTWQVSRTENALLLVLSSNEYANYYEKRGAEIGLEWTLSAVVAVTASVLFQKDVSMRKSTVLTIFGDESSLPENPPVDQGTRGAFRLGLSLDSREDADYPRNAWYVALQVETGRLSPDPAGTGDVNYAAFTIETNRYTLLPFALQWDIGARLSSSFEQIPTQLYQTLNGYGGIRGTDDAPFPVLRGDRMIRVSTELRTELPELPVVRWLYSRWDLLVFGDAGYLTVAKRPTSPFGFLDAPFDDWMKSVGVGISGESFWPYLGFYVARQIDGKMNRPRFIVRLERSF
jgi:outer membrane protein assembly factor BamA